MIWLRINHYQLLIKNIKEIRVISILLNKGHKQKTRIALNLKKTNYKMLSQITSKKHSNNTKIKDFREDYQEIPDFKAS